MFRAALATRHLTRHWQVVPKFARYAKKSAANLQGSWQQPATMTRARTSPTLPHSSSSDSPQRGSNNHIRPSSPPHERIVLNSNAKSAKTFASPHRTVSSSSSSPAAATQDQVAPSSKWSDLSQPRPKHRVIAQSEGVSTLTQKLHQLSAALKQSYVQNAVVFNFSGLRTSDNCVDIRTTSGTAIRNLPSCPHSLFYL